MSRAEQRRAFEASADNLTAILTFVVTAAEEAGVPLARLPHLELAVDETITNIAHYAYKDRKGEVDVRVFVDERLFEVEFADQGGAFNPLEVPPPDTSSDLEKRKPGGLGIFFTRQMVDEVNYRRDGNRNILKLVIKLP